MNRIKLNITSVSDAYEFSDRLNEFDTDSEYVVEDSCGDRKSDARTHFGITYALSEFDEMYLVNETNDGVFPEFIK